MPSAASSKVQKSFDYTNLDAETFEFLEQQTVKLFSLLKITTSGIIQIGNILTEIKQKLPHGQFLPWLEATVPFHRQTASNFMNTAELAKMYGWTEMSEILTFFDPSALGEIAKPSTSKQAREKAIAMAQKCEFVSSTLAKQLKQEYPKTEVKASLQHKRELKQLPPPPPVLEQEVQRSLPPGLESEIPRSQDKRSKPEIVAFIPRTQEQAQATVNQIQPVPPQAKIKASASEQAEVWWQLDGKHLLFCGDPNSNNFLQKANAQVSLLFAFPIRLDWQPSILAATKYILCEQQLDKVLKKKGWLDTFYNRLESDILDFSETGSQVPVCFLPLPVSSIILNLTNSLLRRAIIAEPDRTRCRAAIDDWKRSGGKVERLDSPDI